jgi:PadR family transcriptional regulator, regulatory protein PadR
MTLQTRLVLGVFLDNPDREHYGLELCHTAGLPSGTIYPLLDRLERAGWLAGGWEDINPAVEGRRRRYYYRLTPDGAERARQALAVAQLPQVLIRHLHPEPGAT